MAALAQGHSKITTFASVFPCQTYTTPTPEVTPTIGTLASPAQSFGGFKSSENVIEETLKLTRAWSTVTKWLLSRLSNTAQHIQQSTTQQQHIQALTMISHSSNDRAMLHDWYLNQVTILFNSHRRHYQSLALAWSNADDRSAMQILTALCEVVDACTFETQTFNETTCTDDSIALTQSLRHAATKCWHSLASSLDCRADVQRSLATALSMRMKASSEQSTRKECWRSDRCRCLVSIDGIHLEALAIIGLGGDVVECAMASAVADFLTTVVVAKDCFRVDWQHRSSCAERLADWTRSVLAPTIDNALHIIDPTKSKFTTAQVDVLVSTAITNLGLYRSSAIFDYVKLWPYSEGAINDIKAFLSRDRTEDKALVCASCETQLQNRLLHAGASTAEVLGIYVNLINVFRKLDARGVLLEKVSPGIRSYLRARNDAVNVLARSLFAEQEAAAAPDMCLVITRELENAVQGDNSTARMMDWDDMSWMPEPIDATTTHKSIKTDDVLSHVLSLFDQEEVIKEVESVLAEQLLSTSDPEVIRETRLLELLKTRLDAAKLQNSEVMLKDIRDSVNFERRLRPQLSPRSAPTLKELQAAIPSQGISVTEIFNLFRSRMSRTQLQEKLRLVAIRRSGLFFPKRSRLPTETLTDAPADTVPDLKIEYRILSSSAWPQMQSTSFAMPTELMSLLKAAEDKFGSLSGQRKLRWWPALSKMSITLELEDRTVQEDDLPAWRVAVIKAFSDDAVSTEGATPEELSQALDMDESLVHEALSYWSGKRVLYQPISGRYMVLERLEMDNGDVQQDQATNTDMIHSLKSQDAMLRKNAAMFEAFIANMLSNGGPKEIGGMMGITNMMKMVLPTFTYGDDEVKWLLGQMKSKGMVQEDGDSWKAA